MMAGLLYFLFMEFNRLKEVFFMAKDQLPKIQLPKYLKAAIRLSIIYIPLLLIAMHGSPNKDPQLMGKYQVKHASVNCNDSVLTVVYFDIKNGCVFQFNNLERRWYGKYVKNDNKLQIKWVTPAGKPAFSGVMSPVNTTGNLVLTGMLGNDSLNIKLQRIK
jgi:hypothetical protein